MHNVFTVRHNMSTKTNIYLATLNLFQILWRLVYSSLHFSWLYHLRHLQVGLYTNFPCSFWKINIAISTIRYIENMGSGCVVLHYWICLIISKLLFLYKHNRTKQQDGHQKQWRYWPYSRVSVIGSCLATNTVGSNSPFNFFLHRNCGKANRA